MGPMHVRRRVEHLSYGSTERTARTRVLENMQPCRRTRPDHGPHLKELLHCGVLFRKRLRRASDTV